MTVDRISAVAHVLPAQARGAGTRQQAPTAGEMLRLAYADTLDGDPVMTTGDGRSLRLAGLGALGQELSEGDVLLVRVLSSAPNVELELFGSVSRHARSVPQQQPAPEQAAMRFDQAALRQIAWRAPDAGALAMSWHALVHGQWRGNTTSVPGAGVRATATPAPLPAGVPAEMNQGNFVPAGRWTFPVYVWGGLPMLLRLVVADADDEHPRPRARRPALRLELNLDLPGLGRIAVQVEWMTGGIQLSLWVEDAAAVVPLRDQLPDMAAAIARSGLHLLRCRLNQGWPAVDVRPIPSGMLPQGPAAAPPELFRAAAEVVLLLAGGPWASVSPASR